MKKISSGKIFLLVLVSGVASIIAAAQAAKALTLKSVSVTLPDGDRDLPDGPGLAAMQGNCISCHTPGMILTQPHNAESVLGGRGRQDAQRL